MAYRVQKSSNKFNAKRTDYDGKWYHSKGEASYAAELDWMKKAGEVMSWERQVKIDLKVNGHHITNYFIDFIATMKDGTLRLIEYKGMESPEWRMKFELLNALLPELYPGAELVIVKHKSTWKPK